MSIFMGVDIHMGADCPICASIIFVGDNLEANAEDLEKMAAEMEKAVREHMLMHDIAYWKQLED